MEGGRTCKDVDGRGDIAEVVEVDGVVGGAHRDLMRAARVVLDAAHVGAHVHRHRRRRLLRRPHLRMRRSSSSAGSAAIQLHVSCHPRNAADKRLHPLCDVAVYRRMVVCKIKWAPPVSGKEKAAMHSG